MAANQRDDILDFLKEKPRSSSKEIFDGIGSKSSYATVKRVLTQLLNQHLIIQEGIGKATKYACSPHFQLLYPIEINQYFEKEIDERTILNGFNLDLIGRTLWELTLFTSTEILKLEALQAQFRTNVSQLSPKEYEKEMERLAIDLSWKSSQIEGNTYSLLETERLLKEKQTATGKTKDDAVMLLNHKEAIDFIVAQKDYLTPLSVMKIEDIHSLLMNFSSIRTISPSLTLLALVTPAFTSRTTSRSFRAPCSSWRPASTQRYSSASTASRLSTSSGLPASSPGSATR